MLTSCSKSFSLVNDNIIINNSNNDNNSSDAFGMYWLRLWTCELGGEHGDPMFSLKFFFFLCNEPRILSTCDLLHVSKF